MIDLQEQAARLQLPLTAAHREALARYERLLDTWGARMNLTAIRDPAQIATRHFLDSLALVAALPPADPAQRLVDVGSGAGFPGALCALWRPGWAVTLVERTQKKAAFLEALARELRLPLQVLATDVDRLRETYDQVVSRAAFPPPEWLRRGARLVSPGGALWVMTSEHEEDLQAPPGFTAALDRRYDVGAGPRRLLAFARAPAAPPTPPPLGR